MDGMSYFGRDFSTAQDTAAADRRAVRAAMAMTVAVFVVVAAAAVALHTTGLQLPGVAQFGAIAVGA